MHLNPYGEYAVLLAVDLLRDPPLTGEQLQTRCEEAGLTVDMAGTDADVEEVADFLTQWVAVVDASDEQARAEALNELLDLSSAHPRLTNHAGDGWHRYCSHPCANRDAVRRHRARSAAPAA